MAIMIDIAIILFLICEHLSDLVLNTASLSFLFACPALLFAHWALLKGAGLPPRVRRTLLWLTGPSLLLCLSLVLGIGYQLRASSMVGGATKEMAQAARREGVPPDCLRQWTTDAITIMIVKLKFLLVLILTIGLLYAHRLRAALRVEGPRKL
jgi:hypothetical protein